ncbi:hypothetical protein HYX02_03835 [Candidatus Woesearchaeota archaeon]|nr:hypothetical protein [Candidatus Woesearchaeota archaeon]
MKKPNFKISDEALIISIVLVIFFAVIFSKTGSGTGAAEKITAMILDDHDISFANDGIIDENKLREIQNMDYDDFKNSLKVNKDFCVYIEDGEGNLILAKGSSRFNEDGIYCSE